MWVGLLDQSVPATATTTTATTTIATHTHTVTHTHTHTHTHTRARAHMHTHKVVNNSTVIIISRIVKVRPGILTHWVKQTNWSLIRK